MNGLHLPLNTSLYNIMRFILLRLVFLAVLHTSAAGFSYADWDRQSFFPNRAEMQREKEAILAYYAKGQLDSIADVVNRMRNHCCHLSNMLIVPSILSHSFSETLVEYSFFPSSGEFQTFFMRISSAKQGQVDTFAKIDAYYSTIVHIADSLRALLPKGSIEYCFASYYSGHFDEFFYRIRHDPLFVNSKVFLAYKRELKITLPEKQTDIGGLVGLWSPLGDLHPLGTHPSVGFFAKGQIWRPLFYGIAFDSRFLDVPNVYEVLINDSLYRTRYYSAFSFTFDMDLRTVRKATYQLYVGWFIGGESVKVLKHYAQNAGDDEFISSWSLGPSLFCRIATKKVGPLIFTIIPEVRLSFLDYRNNENRENVFRSGRGIELRLNLAVSDYLRDHDILVPLRYYDNYSKDFRKTLAPDPKEGTDQ